MQLWDGRWVFAALEDGLPTFRWGGAPSGVATRRQLRARGLRPGGQQPVAQIKWRRGRRWAGLYRLDLAMACRVPSPAQRAALGAALAARRRCRACVRDAGYVVPRSTGLCGDCTDSAGPIGAVGSARVSGNAFERENIWAAPSAA
ncbi:MAG: hypothetical protein L0I76_08470 [Pseudonocardia sp.]|nr:hypothetical protein [Pseudonocardia sp.]